MGGTALRAVTTWPRYLGQRGANSVGTMPVLCRGLRRYFVGILSDTMYGLPRHTVRPPLETPEVNFLASCRFALRSPGFWVGLT